MSLYTLFLIITLISSFNSSKIPIIGIVANPNPNDGGDFTASIINASYVRWLENAGAMTMVIQPWYDEAQLDEIIASVNGIIFLGGDRTLNLSLKYEKNSIYIVHKVIEHFRNGNTIPIWATCQGIQLMHSIFMEKVDLLPFDSFDFPSPINIKNMRSPIFKYYSQKDLADSENLNVYVELHHLGTAPSQYEEYPILKKTFEIVATADDRKGKEYVAIIVGKEYPIYAVQFHPEIVSANRRNFDVNTDTESVIMAEHLANFFIDIARDNGNTFAEDFKKKYHFIDSFVEPMQDNGKGLFYYGYKNNERNFLKRT
jgi:gamma-glutamyl hydrolase